MKYQTVYLIWILFFSACAERQNSKITLVEPVQISNDTSYVFLTEADTSNYLYKSDKYKATQLALENLESGFDSVQIRLWVDHELYKGRELYIIGKSNNEWTAKVYKMMIEKGSDSRDSIISSKVENVIPKSGWSNLISTLSDLEIDILSNMTNIPGLVDMWDDGVNYNIEIATKYMYRYYSYHEPDKFQDKFWQAKNMTQIVQKIRSDLNP